MSEEKAPVSVSEIRRAMESLEDQQRYRVSQRVAELVALYGSRRKLGKALDIDHAYLHHLQKGTKQPSERVLKRLGLLE